MGHHFVTLDGLLVERGDYIMLYIFMGQSCTGKSTVVNKIKEFMDIEVFSGKDYLRMAKNENEAWLLFYEKLSSAALNKDSSKSTIIYLITEKEQLDRISAIEDSYKVKFTASLDTIKSRFAQRMHGKLPQPIEKMLEKQYKEWESIKGDMNVDTTENNDIEKIARLIVGL